jgi:hypothetical protein
MRNLNELNINEGGDPVMTPKLTHRDIEFVESLVGSKLPTSYVEFLTFSGSMPGSVEKGLREAATV